MGSVGSTGSVGSYGSAGVVDKGLQGCATGSIGGSIGELSDNYQNQKKYKYKGKSYQDYEKEENN